MSCTWTVYDSIRDVDEHDWNRLRYGPHDPFMDPRFIRAVEGSMAEKARFRHVVVRDSRGRPIAAACFSLFEIDAELLAEGDSRKVARVVKRIAPPLLRFKVVFCGLPVSAAQSHLRFAPDVDTSAILPVLDQLLHEFAREENARCIIFKEFDDAECERLSPLAELGYRRADSLPVNCAPTDYASFDDYCRRVRSRKRSVLRRSARKFESGGLQVTHMRGDEGAACLYTDDVHRLYDAVLDRAEVELERLPAAFFRELARNLPDESVFTFVHQDDRPVAVAASLLSGRVYHQLFIGVDYELNPQYDLYFNLFFHVLDYAWKRGVEEIVVGQTADTFKQQKLSCYAKPLSLYVKGVNWSTVLALRYAFPVFFPPRMDGARETETNARKTAS